MRAYVLTILTVVATGFVVGATVIADHAAMDARVVQAVNRLDQISVLMEGHNQRLTNVDARLEAVEQRLGDLEELARDTNERLQRLDDAIFGACQCAK